MELLASEFEEGAPCQGGLASGIWWVRHAIRCVPIWNVRKRVEGVEGICVGACMGFIMSLMAAFKSMMAALDILLDPENNSSEMGR